MYGRWRDRWGNREKIKVAVYAKLWERIREKRKDLAYKPLVGKRKRERERDKDRERE